MTVAVDARPLRLFTTLLDPAEAPATELAFAYAQRWEIEPAFDEFKTHQRGSESVLSSKSPALVATRDLGTPVCHYAIRTLMFEAAHHADVDPDRVARRRRAHHSSLPLTGARFSPLRTTDARLARTPSVLLCRRLNPTPTAPLSPAADQTQDAQMARQPPDR